MSQSNLLSQTTSSQNSTPQRPLRERDAFGSLNWNALMDVVEHEEQEMQRLMQAGPVPDDQLEREYITEGKLWSQIRTDKKFVECTNFTELELLNLWYDMQPFIQAAHTRGPTPKVCHQDGFLCTLLWYKLGFSYDELSTFTHLPTTTMRSAMERIHPIILKTLQK